MARSRTVLNTPEKDRTYYLNKLLDNRTKRYEQLHPESEAKTKQAASLGVYHQVITTEAFKRYTSLLQTVKNFKHDSSQSSLKALARTYAQLCWQAEQYIEALDSAMQNNAAKTLPPLNAKNNSSDVNSIKIVSADAKVKKVKSVVFSPNLFITRKRNQPSTIGITPIKSALRLSCAIL